jgi:hypothetical protein
MPNIVVANYREKVLPSRKIELQGSVLADGSHAKGSHIRVMEIPN